MSRVAIVCPHCNKKTNIDLAAEMSMERCRQCGIRINAVNTGAQPVRRKRVTGDPRFRHDKKGKRSTDPGNLRVGLPQIKVLLIFLLLFCAVLAIVLLLIKNRT